MNKKASSLKVAYVFFTCVVVLLLLSATFKLIIMVSQSRFDGTHRFNLLFSINQKKRSIISFEPSTSSLAFLKVPDTFQSTALRGLEVSLDGNIEVSQGSTYDFLVSSKETLSGKDIASILFQVLFSSSTNKTTITPIDTSRLLLFSYDLANGEAKTGE